MQQEKNSVAHVSLGRKASPRMHIRHYAISLKMAVSHRNVKGIERMSLLALLAGSVLESCRGCGV